MGSPTPVILVRYGRSSRTLMRTWADGTDGYNLFSTPASQERHSIFIGSLKQTTSRRGGRLSPIM